MKAVLKYPGAKNRIVDWICGFIPQHDVYLEPFLGSAAVFLSKEKAKIETINDLNKDVVNYFNVLRNNPEELIRGLELTPYARDEYYAAYEDADSDVEKARKFVVRCEMGFGCSNLYRNGFRSSQQIVSPCKTKIWKELPETLYQATERLRDAQIENLPAIELIKRYNTPDVFIYADPPYPLSTRKNYIYRHEMSDQDHIELLKTLLDHPGPVLISSYENELYNDLLSGWTKAHKETNAEKGVARTEILYMNYDKQMTIFDYQVEEKGV